MSRALVTGHKGFVGTAITAALKHDGHHVDGCDIKDGSWADCRGIFADDAKEPYDLIVHCAAVVGGRLTISGDPLAVAVDLALDSDMFRWAARGNAKRVVYFSSSAAYPSHLQVPGRHMWEDDINLCSRTLGVPDMTYGWAKLTGEMLAGHARDRGVIVHVLRPFSGYGETQDVSYPFAAFIERAKRRADPFDIWGDGDQARDFIHLNDIVGATRAVMAANDQLPLNVGWGRPTSFNVLAAMITNAVGYDPKYKHHVAQPTGPQWRVADTTRLQRIYKPTIALEEGIARSLGK